MIDQAWDGVWPTMVTPFNNNNDIDYPSLERLIEWYVSNGVSGLFAVCQSSEMFALTLEERVELAQFVVKQAAGRLPVVASGHIGNTMQEQLLEIEAISQTGIDAFVLVSNRLATPEEDDHVLIDRLQTILQSFPETKFGIYECPYPYKRLLSHEVLEWCSQTDQIIFLKDTCCDEKLLTERLDIIRDSPLKLYNANSTTLLHSLQLGAAGYSGVMANIHPDLYVWLTQQFALRVTEAEQLQLYLTLSSLIENLAYPISAKYYLQQIELFKQLAARTKQPEELNSHMQLVLDQLLLSDALVRSKLPSL